MEAISKPHLVDLLRTFDRRRWVVPRIRYASVRSKGELIEDIRRHYRDSRTGQYVRFEPVRKALRLMPAIVYHLATRRFLLDGAVVDLPRKSRQPLRCSIERRRVTIRFAQDLPAPSPPPAGFAE